MCDMQTKIWAKLGELIIKISGDFGRPYLTGDFNIPYQLKTGDIKASQGADIAHVAPLARALWLPSEFCQA